MKQPNIKAKEFCIWLIYSGFLRLSSARLTLFNLVINSVDTQTPLTEYQYNQFIKSTSYLYPAYNENTDLISPNAWSTLSLDNNILLNPHFNNNTSWSAGGNVAFNSDSVNINYDPMGLPISQNVNYLVDEFYLLQIMPASLNGNNLYFSPNNGGNIYNTTNMDNLFSVIWKATNANSNFLIYTNTGGNMVLLFASIQRIIFN